MIQACASCGGPLEGVLSIHDYLAFIERTNETIHSVMSQFPREGFTKEGFTLHPHTIHVLLVAPIESLPDLKRWVDERTEPGSYVHIHPEGANDIPGSLVDYRAPEGVPPC